MIHLNYVLSMLIAQTEINMNIINWIAEVIPFCAFLLVRLLVVFFFSSLCSLMDFLNGFVFCVHASNQYSVKLKRWILLQIL